MRRLILLTLLPGLVLALIVLRIQSAGSTDTSSLSEFSGERALSTLTSTVDMTTPHPLGSEKSDVMRQKLAAHLQSLGWSVREQRSFVCLPRESCADLINLVAEPPVLRPGKVVLLAVHYDSVGAGPGVSDDGSGVAIALEIARAMAREKHRNDVVLLIDDGEEAGLYGAEAFVKDDPLKDRIGAVVNLEARGTTGGSFMFETAPENGSVIRALARSLPHPSTSSLFYTIYKRLPNDTDFTVFKRAGMQGVNFGFVGSPLRYHTREDNLANLSRATLQQHGDHALAMIRAFADTDFNAPAAPDAVWFDFLNFFIVLWPESWTVFLAIAALLLSIGSAVVAVRRGEAGGKGIVAGIAWWLLAVVSAGVLAYGAGFVLRASGAFINQWVANPYVAIAAIWLLAITAVLSVRSISRARLDLLVASSLWLASLSLLLAILAPGASYLTLIPALACSTALLTPKGARRFVLPLAVVLTASVLLVVSWLLYDALGLPILPLIAATVAIVWSVAVFGFDGRSSWKLPVAVGAAGLLALGAALVIPGYSKRDPRPLNVFFDQEGQKARWVVSIHWSPLPPAMAKAHSWKTDEAYPWYPGSSYYIAAAPPVPSFPPQLVVESVTPTATGRVVQARMVSPRGADRGVIRAQRDRLKTVKVNGVELSGGLSQDPWRQIRLATLKRGSPVIELTVEGAEPFELIVDDESFGLPPLPETPAMLRGETIAAVGGGDITLVRSRTRI